MHLKISRIISNLGDNIDLPANGVTCIVGANNVGKSQLLADIRRHIYATPDGLPVVLSEVGTEPALPLIDPAFVGYGMGETGVPQRLLDLLLARAGAIWPDQAGTPQYTPKGGGQNATARQIQSSMSQSRLDQIAAPWFITDNAIGSSVTAQFYNSMQGTPDQDPSLMGMVVRSWEVEQQVSRIFEQGFDSELTLDTVSGGGFRIGLDDKSLLVGHRPTEAYRRQISQLPKLSSQGQGVQAYMSLAVTITLGDADIFIFDEPETYLHPPQARALGRLVGQQATDRGKQVICVTHDKDFIIGLLESTCPLNFVRVSREGTGNRLHHVNTSLVKHVWTTAVLRYSNLLEGLFYRRVIVCEAEPDCRFYGAVLDGIVEDSEMSARAAEAIFLGASGKAGVPKRVEALASLGCDIKVILDVDALCDGPSLLRRIAEALGREWKSEWTNWINTVSSAVSSEGVRPQLKLAGINVMQSAPARIAAAALVDELSGVGIHVLATGVLESFYASSAQEKERWVDEVLEAGLHKSLQAPRDFMKAVVTP